MVKNILLLGYCYTDDISYRCACHKGWGGNNCGKITCDDIYICSNNSFKKLEKCQNRNNIRICDCENGLIGYNCKKSVCKKEEIEKCRPYGKFI